jgi:hypothetical protein
VITESRETIINDETATRRDKRERTRGRSKSMIWLRDPVT